MKEPLYSSMRWLPIGSVRVDDGLVVISVLGGIHCYCQLEEFDEDEARRIASQIRREFGFHG